MKKFILGLTLIISSLSYAQTQISNLALVSARYDLKQIVENSFGVTIEIMEYADDGESLNVFHDSRVCHNVILEELDINSEKTLVVTQIRRDVTCDK